jgi:hypothetical protein
MDTKYMNVSMHEAKRLAAEMLPHERNDIIQALDRDNARSVEIAVAHLDNQMHRRLQIEHQQLKEAHHRLLTEHQHLRLGLQQLLDA